MASKLEAERGGGVGALEGTSKRNNSMSSQMKEEGFITMLAKLRAESSFQLNKAKLLRMNTPPYKDNWRWDPKIESMLHCPASVASMQQAKAFHVQHAR